MENTVFASKSSISSPGERGGSSGTMSPERFCHHQGSARTILQGHHSKVRLFCFNNFLWFSWKCPSIYFSCIGFAKFFNLQRKISQLTSFQNICRTFQDFKRVFVSRKVLKRRFSNYVYGFFTSRSLLNRIFVVWKFTDIIHRVIAIKLWWYLWFLVLVLVLAN